MLNFRCSYSRSFLNSLIKGHFTDEVKGIHQNEKRTRRASRLCTLHTCLQSVQKSLFFSLNMQICDCLVAVVIARAAYSVIRSALPALTSGWCYFVLFPVQLLSGALYITCFSRCIFDDFSHLLQLFHRLAVLDSLKYKSSTIVVLHVIECTSLKATHIMPRRTLTCSSKGK